MSASDNHDRPVALLARPGAARERLKEALLAAGGQLVLEEDPNVLDAATLQASPAVVVLVALEPAVEDALERLEPVLEAAHLNLLFDEAELAARREGWEAQRWVRHLAAKLHGHDNVLPPGQEEEDVASVSLPEPGMPERPAERHAGAPLQFHVDEALVHADEVPADTLYVADAATPPSDVLSFEELMAMAPRTPEAPVAAAVPPPLPEPVADAGAVVMPPPMPAVGSYTNWSLLEDDAYAAPAAEATPQEAPVIDSFLGSALSLVEEEGEAAAAAAASAPGAVLLLAGIGGPDAVRRLLGGLPPEFPYPVLVQMRLDGGRYDNLVRQMARVAALPVQLAALDGAAEGGNVYVLPDGVGLQWRDGAPGFVESTQSLVASLVAEHGGIVMLSGADPALVPEVLAFAARGGWVAGQHGEGCYDPAAASQLAAAGMTAGTPEFLASELVQRSAG